MTSKTIRDLNQITTIFYESTAHYFARSREFYWQGWRRLQPYIRRAEQLTVLDVGCGTARFAPFILESAPRAEVSYVGIDNSTALLNIARERLALLERLTASLQKSDIIGDRVNNYLATGEYDIIALMGMYHHIPSLALRESILTSLSQRLQSGGFLFLSFWQPHRFSRYTSKAIHPSRVGFKEDDLELGDMFLPWERGVNSIRYVHSPSDSEIQQIISALGLRIKAEYKADGRSQRENHYVLLQKQS